MLISAMLHGMLMIATASAARASGQAPVLIFLATFAAAGVYMGARWVFNLHGAVDKALARRRAVLELKGQQTGNLSLADTESLGPWFFKLVGGVLGVAGLILLAISLLLIAA
ncbi:hypothetical protein JS756_29585 [Streptomyces actuosus]|uniref:DUF3899 domain-containing protein n=1 Tax=Streptomyces actuosus TaxID=1885 RepID=A0ABS2VYI7_STRAS|nr:hypothetical protein [Streptomyces actuosus]MBN0048189.1 hypothetical protein [Streptomyces actuosus]